MRLLDEEKGLVGIGLSLVQRPERDIVTNVTNGHVADNGNAAVGVGLQTEGQDGDQDEEDRSEGHHLEERIEGSKCRRSNARNQPPPVLANFEDCPFLQHFTYFYNISLTDDYCKWDVSIKK